MNIDRIWSLWQDQSNAHKLAQSGESNYHSAMTGVSNGETPEDFTDLSNQYGGVCAEYEDLSAPGSGRRALTTKEERVANTVSDVLDILKHLPVKFYINLNIKKLTVVKLSLKSASGDKTIPFSP